MLRFADFDKVGEPIALLRSNCPEGKEQRNRLQFAVSGIVLAVIAGCFPLLFRRPRRQKVTVSAAKPRQFAVFSRHLSAISASARNPQSR
jgi:hypothetical protein